MDRIIALVIWISVAHGVTQIITSAKVTRWLRRVFPPLLCCAMCVGFWVGIGLCLAGFDVVSQAFSTPKWARVIASGAASSAWAYLIACWHPLPPDDPEPGTVCGPPSEAPVKREPAGTQLTLPFPEPPQ